MFGLDSLNPSSNSVNLSPFLSLQVFLSAKLIALSLSLSLSRGHILTSSMFKYLEKRIRKFEGMILLTIWVLEIMKI